MHNPYARTKVHARNKGIGPCGPALCSATSPHGLNFGDGPYAFPVTCKNCLKMIDEENARLRAGVE